MASTKLHTSGSCKYVVDYKVTCGTDGDSRSLQETLEMLSIVDGKQRPCQERLRLRPCRKRGTDGTALIGSAPPLARDSHVGGAGSSIIPGNDGLEFVKNSKVRSVGVSHPR